MTAHKAGRYKIRSSLHPVISGPAACETTEVWKIQHLERE